MSSTRYESPHHRAPSPQPQPGQGQSSSSSPHHHQHQQQKGSPSPSPAKPFSMTTNQTSNASGTNTFPSKAPQHARLSLGPGVGSGGSGGGSAEGVTSGSSSPGFSNVRLMGEGGAGGTGTSGRGDGRGGLADTGGVDVGFTGTGRSTPNLNRHTLAGATTAGLGGGIRHVSGPGGMGSTSTSTSTTAGGGGGGGGTIAGDRLAAARNLAPSSPSLASFGNGAVYNLDSDPNPPERERTTSYTARSTTATTNGGSTSQQGNLNPGLRSVSSGTIGSLRPQSEYLSTSNHAQIHQQHQHGRLGGAGAGLSAGSVGAGIGIGMGIGGLAGVSAGMLGGLGMGGGHLMASPDINQDSWVSDYEAQLEAMASASMEQNFIDELQAIESWFRVLTENERTATLYSLLQQSTPLQIRFFQNVLRQMGSADPMSALLSPAPGGGAGSNGMQAAQQEAVANASRYGLGVVGNGMGGLRSPGLGNGTGASLRSPSARGGFDTTHNLAPNSPMAGHFLGPESAVTMDSLSAQIQRQRNRTSAPGTLTGLAHDIGRFASQLDNVIERGPSPAAGASNGGRSPIPGGQVFGADAEHRPKSTDFAGMVQQDTHSPFQRSPRPGDIGVNAGIGIGLGLPVQEPGGHNLQPPTTQQRQQQQQQQQHHNQQQQQQFAYQNPVVNNPLAVPSPRFDAAFSPLLTGNWSSIVNTPLLPMFQDNSDMVGAALQAASHNLANMNLSSGINRVVLDDASKFRKQNLSAGRGNGANNSGLYNEEGDMLSPGAAQPGRSTSPAYAAQSWRSSPLAQQEGFAANGNGNGNALSGLTGLGMGMGGFDSGAGAGLGVGLGTVGGIGMGQFGYTHTSAGGQPGAGQRVSTRRLDPSLAARRSPLLRQAPGPSAAGAGASAMGVSGGAGQGAGVAGPEDVRESILKDIPTWLRILRLHKYTTNFAQAKWQDMVLLNDDQLVDQGVAALGARRKMLKAFANVRTHYGIAHPEGYEPDTTTGPGDE